MRHVQQIAVLANGQIVTRNVDFLRIQSPSGMSIPGLGVFAWIKCCMADWARGIVHRKRISSAIRELDAMDDHILEDIGISRCEIPIVVEKSMLSDTKLAASRMWR